MLQITVKIRMPIIEVSRFERIMKSRLFVTGAAIGAVCAALFGGMSASAAAGLPYDGTDAATTGCSSDAKAAASFPIKTTAGVVAGTMTVYKSAKCGTMWVHANNLMSGTTAGKYIERQGDGMTYFYDNDYTATAGLGSSHGLQFGVPACVTAWTNLYDSANVIVAKAGTHIVC